ncbi:MAG: hypothetical protein KAZ88_09800 [Acidimicrobiia bacterium]|nr:hypothetical protein [Acidimicrobiia bacterium]
MSRVLHLRPQFVDLIPSQIDDGVIYVSIKYRTAAHNCCCGCGQKVVTPISPTDWQIGFDGVDVSVTPSVGNWSFACQSHYWIKRGDVHWSYKFSPEEIRRARDRDHRAAQNAASEVASRSEDERQEVRRRWPWTQRRAKRGEK